MNFENEAFNISHILNKSYPNVAFPRLSICSYETKKGPDQGKARTKGVLVRGEAEAGKLSSVRS